MVLPLYDDRPDDRTSPPYVTWGLIALNMAVFLAFLALPPGRADRLEEVFGFVPVRVETFGWHGALPVLVTAVTYSFLHDGWVHILGNMLFLWIFGDNVEDALGHARFALFYVACAIAGAAAYFISDPYSEAVLVGASGAIAGIIAAYLMIRPCAKVEVLLIPFAFKLSAYWVLGFWIATQLWHIVLRVDDGIAWWDHVGGMTLGAILLVLLRRPDVALFECMRVAEPSPPS